MVSSHAASRPSAPAIPRHLSVDQNARLSMYRRRTGRFVERPELPGLAHILLTVGLTLLFVGLGKASVGQPHDRSPATHCPAPAPPRPAVSSPRLATTPTRRAAPFTNAGASSREARIIQRASRATRRTHQPSTVMTRLVPWRSLIATGADRDDPM